MTAKQLTPLRLLPPPEAAQALIDFDGTITKDDVIDELILKFAADDSWRATELLWQSGAIGSRECLEREFAVLRAMPGELNALLDEIQIDPGAARLLGLLNRVGVPAAILSDGIDRYIERIMKRAGIGGIEVRANTVEHCEDRLTFRRPFASDACESAAAHCKCASARALKRESRQTIYIGDGRSDLCPARRADFVFAKGALASCLDALGLPYFRFADLNDVADVLEASWKTSRGGS